MTVKSKFETGHAKNVANFEDLIARCISYGAEYNPSRPELQLSSLQQLHQEAQLILSQLTEREIAAQNVTNNRSAVFKTLSPLVTKIINALVASGATAKTIEDARAIQRKINGTRAGKKTKNDDASANGVQPEGTASEQPDSATAAAPRQISTSRQSYDLKVEHFARLVMLLQSTINYAPNEMELQLTTLQSFLQNLRFINSSVTTTETELETIRIQRTSVFYDLTNGLCARAQQVKSYVKSLFGNSSPKYKQISNINFRSF